MRYREFISEAGLPYSQLSKHAGIYLIRLIDKIAKGDRLQLTNGKTVTIDPALATELSNAAFNSPTPPDIADVNVDSSNKISPTDAEVLKKILSALITKSGNTVTSGNILKSPEIKGAGKGFNTGNVAEGILGAAVTAAFKKGTTQPVKAGDIVNIIQALGDPEVLKKNAVLGQLQTKTKGNKLEFKLGLGRSDYQALVEMAEKEKFHPEVLGLLRSATAYVNQSAVMKEALEQISLDKKSNTIIVNSDGVSDNTGTKADLFIEIDGEPINLVSLKSSNTKQFGQASGHRHENMKNFFEGTLGVLIPAKIIDLFTDEQSSEEVKQHVVPKVYESITKQIEKQLSTNKGEALFIDRLYDGIFMHTSQRDPKLSMVILKNTPSMPGYTELNFGPSLIETMKQYRFEVVNEPQNYIKIFGYPTGKDAKEESSRKELLIQLRSQLMGGIMRNVVEMGPLLKNIATVEQKIEKKK